MRDFAIAAYKGDIDALQVKVEQENFPINSQYEGTSHNKRFPKTSNVIYYSKKTIGYGFMGFAALYSGIWGVGAYGAATTTTVALGEAVGLGALSTMAAALTKTIHDVASIGDDYLIWDREDKHKMTGLHFAAMTGKTEAALYLLRKGANPALRDHFDRDFLKIAKDNGHQDFIFSCHDDITKRIQNRKKRVLLEQKHRRELEAQQAKYGKLFVQFGTRVKNDIQELLTEIAELERENAELRGRDQNPQPQQQPNQP